MRTELLFRDEIIQEGVKQLNQQLQRTRTQNYPELCWFLWSSLSLNPTQLKAIDNTINLLHDQFLKNEVESRLEKIGLAQFRVGPDYHHSRQTILLLTLLNHLIELSPFYDLFLSILEIAGGQYAFYNPVDNSFEQKIGSQIKSKDDEGNEVDAPIRIKKEELKNYFSSNPKLQRLWLLFDRSFDINIRNTFSHSEYEIQKDGIKFIQTQHAISYNDLCKKTFGAFYIVSWVLRFVEKEQQDFIKSGGYLGPEYRIVPIIKNNGMSLRVDFYP